MSDQQIKNRSEQYPEKNISEEKGLPDMRKNFIKPLCRTERNTAKLVKQIGRTEYPGSENVTAVPDRPHGQWVGDPGESSRQWNIGPQIVGKYRSEHHLERNRQHHTEGADKSGTCKRFTVAGPVDGIFKTREMFIQKGRTLGRAGDLMKLEFDIAQHRLILTERQ